MYGDDYWDDELEAMAQEKAAKWQNGKKYHMVASNGCRVTFELENFSADVVRRFTQTLGNEIIKAARKKAQTA